MRVFVFLCLLQATVVSSQPYDWEFPQDGGRIPVKVPDNEYACLTDQASCGCCLMQRQMERTTQFFNYTYNLLAEYLAESKNAINSVRASRSAFSVSLDTSPDDCFGPFSNSMTVTYRHVYINLGNNFDTTTGVYTAPLSGVYSLAFTIYSHISGRGNLNACANLLINGNTVASLQEKSNQDKQDSGSAAITRQLMAGDQVAVVLPAGCALCDPSQLHNTFTGYLLYATN